MTHRAAISHEVGQALNLRALITSDHRTGDIINQIIKNHYANLPAAKKIAHHFNASSNIEVGRKIWNFLKSNIQYRIEPAHMQTTKTIQRFMSDGFGDCKHLSNFTGTILHALGIPFAYRFVSFGNSKEPTHVYIVAYDGAREIPIDAVLSFYNTEKPYTHKIDKKMSLYQLSGIDTLGEVDTMHYVGSADGDEFYISGKNKILHLANNANGNARDMVFTPATYNVLKTIGSIGSDMDYIGTIGDADFYNSMNGIGRPRILKKAANVTKQVVKKVSKPAVKVVKTVAKPVAKQVVKTANNISKKAPGVIKRTGKGIVKAGKGAVKIVKKSALVGPRTAFRGLVALNVRGWATGIQKANAKDSNQVRKMWEKVGGNYGDLMSAVNAGAKKKRIMGIESIGNYTIGEPTTIAASIAAASPIIAIIIPLIKRIGGSEDGQGNNPTQPSELDNIIDIVDQLTPQNNGRENNFRDQPQPQYNFQPQPQDNFQPSPTPNSDSGSDTTKYLLIGGAALALFIFTRK